MNNKTYNIKMHTISPINIGSGEDFSPLSFWIDDKNKKLIEFNEKDLLDTLSEEEKKRIIDMCEKPTEKTLSELYSIVNEKKPKGYRHIDVCEPIITKYRDSKIGTNINQFQIKKTMTNPNTHKTYIPGSSLKGAIRTSYINSLVNKKFSDSYNKNSKIDEKEILGGAFSKDPFTTLKVSDLQLEENGETEILFSLRIGKKKTDNVIPIMIEVIKPNSVFTGSISINTNIKTAIQFEKIEEILSTTNKFYLNIINDKKIGISSAILNKIKEKQEKIKNKTFICRLGSNIGAESHTIENNREIRIRNLNKTLPYATTYIKYSRDAKTPIDSFGWCIIEVIGSDKTDNDEETENSNQNNSPFKW